MNERQTQGIDWTAIFEKRPDLKPPGYEETVAIMRQKHQRKSDENA